MIHITDKMVGSYFSQLSLTLIRIHLSMHHIDDIPAHFWLDLMIPYYTLKSPWFWLNSLTATRFEVPIPGYTARKFCGRAFAQSTNFFFKRVSFMLIWYQMIRKDRAGQYRWIRLPRDRKCLLLKRGKNSPCSVSILWDRKL